jgi:DNA-binding transcriptional MocR family regulator
MKASAYKRPDGVIALPRVMIRSPAYRALSLAARCLIVELQNRWAPNRAAIDFSTRDAAEALGASQATAVRAFHELAQREFIVLAVPADHGARKARGWRLTWNQSPDGREPTDEWAKPAPPKKSRVATKPRNPESDSTGKRERPGPKSRERGINDLASLANRHETA